MPRLSKRNIIILTPLLGILLTLFLILATRPTSTSLPAEPTSTPSATVKASATPEQEISEALPTASPAANQQDVT
ncbi:MAG: hypothetical protein KDJ65_17885, partial [Anaerolineae bacterium]|nr:hypothetical protein [Anaerolineae bacterium]